MGDTNWKELNHEIPENFEKYVTMLAEAGSAKNELILITRFQKIIRLIYDQEISKLRDENEMLKTDYEEMEKALEFYGKAKEVWVKGYATSAVGSGVGDLWLSDAKIVASKVLESLKIKKDKE